ncbi:FAD-dependent oxidoreductase [Thermaurantiacus sp.]
MIRDARSGGLPDSADLIIIGSGAAGITLALEYLDRPERVVLLEAGGVNFDRAVQQDYASAAVSPPTHFPGAYGRRRAFGGTTAIWGGRCIPFAPIDFEARDWIPCSGWPVGPEAFSPYLDRAMEIMEAGEADFTLKALAGDRAPLAADPEGFFDLEHVERFSPPLDFGKRYGPELARAGNLEVWLHAPVLRIHAENGRVTGVETPSGRIAAPRVVLAAGGIETARLLLVSGLGGENVGRYYQTHIRLEFGTVIVPSNDRADYQRSTDGVWCRRYIALPAGQQRARQLPQAVLRPHNPPVADPAHGSAILSMMHFLKGVILPEYRAIIAGDGRVEGRAAFDPRGLSGHLRNILLGLGSLLLFSWKWLTLRILRRRKLPSVFVRSRVRRYAIDLQMEQVPNPDSRILIDPDQRDSHGVPRVRIDWRTTPADRELLARLVAYLRESGASGDLIFDVGDIDPATVDLVPIAHHIGTARMALAPADGVCDPNGELFDTKGLFVAGAATFPTGSFANPTLLIVMQTLRLAAHLKQTQKEAPRARVEAAAV